MNYVHSSAHTCSWCRKAFSSVLRWRDHLVDSVCPDERGAGGWRGRGR